MQIVNDLWTPTGMHGTITVPTGTDVQAAVLSKLRLLIGPSQFSRLEYDEIKACLTNQSDGSTEVFFELIFA